MTEKAERDSGKKALRRRIAFAVAVAPGLCVLAVGLVSGALGYRVNLTPSMPLGIWKKVDFSAVRGSVVAACVPPGTPAMAHAIQHNYLPDGACDGSFAPVLKRIMALEGDIVELTDDAVRVNGQLIPNTATLRSDARGPMPAVARGTYQTSSDHFWLLANQNPRSFDSRYFGPIARINILYGVTPVLVAGP